MTKINENLTKLHYGINQHFISHLKVLKTGE